MSQMSESIAKVKAEGEQYTWEENLARYNAVSEQIAERNAAAAAETKLYAYGLPAAFFGTVLLSETLAAKAAAAEFIGPPESIAGVGAAESFVGPMQPVVAAPSVGANMTLEEMANQWLAEPALPGAGEVASKTGTFWDSVSGTWKAVTGGIDTLATVLPKVNTIYKTIEGILGKEGQETVPVAQNPSNPPPSSSSPVVNLTIPPQSTGGIVLTTPAAEQPNYMLYAGLAIIAIILFKGL